MARRFKRDNFLFPYNLERQRPDVAARPVDAFEQADEGTVIQAPQRPYEVSRPDGDNRLLSLARQLGTLQQTADSVGQKHLKAFTGRAEAAGAALALEEERKGNKYSWQKTIGAVRRNDGDEAAGELMRLNPHVQRGYDQTRARSASLNYNAELQAAFASNPVLDEETGVRLRDVDVSDPAYQQWLANFGREFNTRYNVDTLDPTAAAAIVPAVQDVNQRVTVAQSELRGQRKLRDFEDSTAEFVGTAVMDLHSNALWKTGEDSLAPSEAAAAISAQIDEAHALGFGGADLDRIYENTIQQIISAAEVTNDAALLQVAELIEIGPEGSEMFLLDTGVGVKYVDMLTRAQDRIQDREHTLWQRENAIEDRTREESRIDAFNNVAQAAALVAITGRAPEALLALDQALTQGRAEAAEHGYLPDFNAAVSQVTQDAVDNQGTTYVNYQAMAFIESQIQNGDIGGIAAQQAISQLYQSGQLGNDQDAAGNMLRLNGAVIADRDRNVAAFQSELQSASNDVATVIEQRLGMTRDENNRLVGIKDTLIASGFDEAGLRTLQGMNASQLNDYIQKNAAAAQIGEAIPFSSTMIQAMNMVVNGNLDVLSMPDNPDPQEVLTMVNQFQNMMWMEHEEFKSREGRDWQPQERAEALRRGAEAYLSGQRSTLPSSNPSSTVRTPSGAAAQFAQQAYGVNLEGVGESTANPRSTQIMNTGQLANALMYRMQTDNWHPEIVALARANNMTPQELYENQSKLNGVTVDPNLAMAIGMPRQAARQEGGPLPSNSVYAPNISSSYSSGEYSVFTGHWVDDSPPGSYDFTLLQNGNSKVNIPSPGNARVVSAGWISGYGNTIEVQVGGKEGYRYFFAHLDSPAYWQPGDLVSKGQALAKQGTTGNSTGDHIHLELRDRNGGRITNRQHTEPIAKRYLDDIRSGYFLPTAGGSSRASSSAPRATTGGSGGLDNTQFVSKASGDMKVRANLIRDTATRLGVPADELGAVLFLESGLDPTARGGDGKLYEGLAQFGPNERAMYGINRWSTSQAQLAALERFLNDRGYRPGMGIGRLYATILGGNPDAYNAFDSNDTSAATAEPTFKLNGWRNTEARRLLGW